MDLFRCISKEMGNHAGFLQRYHSSALTFSLQAFMPPFGNQVRGLNDSPSSQILLIATTYVYFMFLRCTFIVI